MINILSDLVFAHCTFGCESLRMFRFGPWRSQHKVNFIDFECLIEVSTSWSAYDQIYKCACECVCVLLGVRVCICILVVWGHSCIKTIANFNANSTKTLAQDRSLWVCGCWLLAAGNFGSLAVAAVAQNCWPNNCVRLVVVTYTYVHVYMCGILANAYLNETTATRTISVREYKKTDPITLCRLADANFTIQLTHATSSTPLAECQYHNLLIFFYISFWQFNFTFFCVFYIFPLPFFCTGLSFWLHSSFAHLEVFWKRFKAYIIVLYDMMHCLPIFFVFI